MWLSALSALASLGGTVASGVGSALANKAEKEQIEKERGAMNHWYNQQIYQDPTKRADYNQMMNQLKMTLRKKNDIEDNKRTILGGTNETALAQQQYNSNAIADVAEQQMANQSKRVDVLLAQQRAETTNYDRQQANLRARQFETWGNLAHNAAQSFSGFADDGTTGVKTTTTTPKDGVFENKMLDDKNMQTTLNAIEKKTRFNDHSEDFIRNHYNNQ